MSTAPKVSVIVTTYNRSAMLVEAIHSVLAQSYRDWELIVADDGSSDDTAERVASFGDSLRYLQLGHSGKPEVARNCAIAQARGAFFAFLDDDDLWYEDKLMRQMAVLEADPALGYAYSDLCFQNPDGSRSSTLLLPAHKESDAVFENLLQGCFVHPSTVVIRRSTFEAVGPFDEGLYCQGDYLLWLRATQAAPVACITKTLVAVRRSSAGISSQRRLLNIENAILVLERLRQERALSWKQRMLSRRTLSRWYATLGLRRDSAQAARRDLLRSLRLNPLQRTAWRALAARARTP